jgi:hypothetical protein
LGWYETIPIFRGRTSLKGANAVRIQPYERTRRRQEELTKGALLVAGERRYLPSSRYSFSNCLASLSGILAVERKVNPAKHRVPSPPSLLRWLQTGRPQPIAHMGCRFSLARAPQQQLAGLTSGRLVFGRSPKSIGFFRHPFFEGSCMLNAAAFHDALLLTLYTAHVKALVQFASVPFPT